MISSIPIYYLGALTPTASFFKKWTTIVNKFIFGQRKMRPSDTAAALAVGDGGIKMWHPRYIQCAIACYCLHKFLSSNTPDWTLAPIQTMLDHELPIPPWWQKAYECAALVGIVPAGHLTKWSYRLAVNALKQLNHDSIFEKLHLWWSDQNTLTPRLTNHFRLWPRVYREWWRTPLPARIRDFGWLVMWGKNHGGANSLRHPQHCGVCNSPTTDPYHWAISCTYHQHIMDIFTTFPCNAVFRRTTALNMWARALQRNASALSRDGNIVPTSWILYLCWWTFHFVSEGPAPDRDRRAQHILQHIDALVRHIQNRHTQWVLDWMTEQGAFDN